MQLTANFYKLVERIYEKSAYPIDHFIIYDYHCKRKLQFQQSHWRQ
jgi:hypothetical protein